MRLLGDGMFMFQSLRLLRDAGHDTATVARQYPSPRDPDVIRRAAREGRILLTFDKDFRRHIYEERLAPPPGVVFFSIFLPRPREAGERLLVLLDGGVELEGAYTTVTRDGYEQESLP